MDAAFYHRPVLLDEVVEVLRPAPGRTFLDGTLGGGGHARALLEAGARVIALDQDPDAVAHAGALAGEFGDRLCLRRANFRRMRPLLESLGNPQVDGILLDLGVSSWQLERAQRGFSFRADGPLDMRMDPDLPGSAADLVNTADVEELERIFRKYGEEPRARAIARHLGGKRPFATTLELASAVEHAGVRPGKRHPATRVFQALRLAVNDELGALEEALENSAACLLPGGRLAVITFHSLEDRMVKHFIRETTRPEIDRPEWPAPRPNPRYFYRPIGGTPRVPAAGEIALNPRARSARLRAAERNA